jgi:hypothetical protein
MIKVKDVIKTYVCDDNAQNTLGNVILYVGEFDRLIKVSDWNKFYYDGRAIKWGQSCALSDVLKRGISFTIVKVVESIPEPKPD